MRCPGLAESLGSNQSQESCLVTGSDDVLYFIQTVIVLAEQRGICSSEVQAFLSDVLKTQFVLHTAFMMHKESKRTMFSHVRQDCNKLFFPIFFSTKEMKFGLMLNGSI